MKKSFILISILSLLSCKNKTIQLQEIMNNVENTYANCVFYKDSGFVSTKFRYFTKDSTFLREEVVKKQFKTVFSEKGNFRFEYFTLDKKDSDRYIIHKNKNGDVKTWWDLTNKERKYVSIGKAIGSVAGVSSRTSVNITKFLFPEEIKLYENLLRDLTILNFIKTKKLKNKSFYIINGNTKKHSCEIWINRDSYLVEKIKRWKKFNGFDTESTTVIYSEINREIDESNFEYNKY